MYLDQIKKIAYYKSRIIGMLAREGIYPDNAMIKERMSSINDKVAIYSAPDVITGENFDTEQFNQDMVNIMTDLKILYELAYKICIEDYNEVKAYAVTHIKQLEALARSYQYKTALEIDSTYLGETIFYQGSGFDISGNNGVKKIKLGTVNVTPGAKLVCIIDTVNEIDNADITFDISIPSLDKKLVCPPYNYNKDTIKMPGNMKCKAYEYFSPNNGILRSAFPMTPEGMKLNRKNTYIVYGGKDKIQTGYLSDDYISKQSGVPNQFSKGGKLTFYVVNGTYIDFNFNKEPLTKNFTGTSIHDMPKHKKITIEYSAGFAFDFITDGVIYATCDKAYIRNNDLMYPNMTSLNDFMIEEYSSGEKEPCNINVYVNNFNSGELLRVNAIAIKEISELQEEGLE